MTASKRPIDPLCGDMGLDATTEDQGIFGGCVSHGDNGIRVKMKQIMQVALVVYISNRSARALQARTH